MGHDLAYAHIYVFMFLSKQLFIVIDNVDWTTVVDHVSLLCFSCSLEAGGRTHVVIQFQSNVPVKPVDWCQKEVANHWKWAKPSYGKN